MKIYQFFICLFFIILGCSTSKVEIDNLHLKTGKYYFLGASKAFSGEAISKFDNGNVSNVIEFKDGIPEGKWIAYGYNHEVVQEGNYFPVDINNDSSLKNILRLNLCTTKEGNVEFTDAFIITNTPTQFKEDEFKPILNAYLKSHDIVIKGDSLNEIKFVIGEFEP